MSPVAAVVVCLLLTLGNVTGFTFAQEPEGNEMAKVLDKVERGLVNHGGREVSNLIVTGEQEDFPHPRAGKLRWNRDNIRVLDFSDPDVQPQTLDALNMWGEPANRLHFLYQDRRDKICNNVNRTDGAIVICTAPENNELWGWCKVWTRQGDPHAIIAAKVVLYVEGASLNEQREVAVHELGHALGMMHRGGAHSGDPFSVMVASGLLIGDPEPTAYDLAVLRRMGYMRDDPDPRGRNKGGRRGR